MKTSDTPQGRQAEAKTDNETAAARAHETESARRQAADAQAASEPVSSKRATLASGEKPRASESSDPTIHRLLAEHDIHLRNGDDQRAKDAWKQIADLGYQ